MANGTIDLRNKKIVPSDTGSGAGTANVRENSLRSSGSADGGASRVPVSEVRAGIVEWEAYEYPPIKYGRRWYAAMAVISLAMLVVGYFSENYFFMAFVGLAFFIIVVYSKRRPGVISCAITDEGVVAGEHVHQFSEVKSYWIFSRPGVHELSLETEKNVNPYVVIPLGDANDTVIREALSRFLQEKVQQETFIDALARRLGF